MLAKLTLPYRQKALSDLLLVGRTLLVQAAVSSFEMELFYPGIVARSSRIRSKKHSAMDSAIDVLRLKKLQSSEACQVSPHQRPSSLDRSTSLLAKQQNQP